MEFTNCVDNAALWLINAVILYTNCKNFEIIKSETLDNGTYVFSVTYVWMLNGWDKNVSKDIHVIYNPEKKTFFTADLEVAYGK